MAEVTPVGKPKRFSIVVATDGSMTARAALATTLTFPWPEESEVRGVVARRTRATRGRPGYVLEAFARAFEKAAADARALLSRRWPDVEVTVVDKSPADAIVDEAHRVRAEVIVLGSHGYGPVRRLLLGSVSRGVVRRAICSVLVVNRRRKQIRRLVIGLDGSPHSRRAVELVAQLPPPPGNLVTLVSALEPISLPSHALLPATVRVRIGRELASLKAELATNARREAEGAEAVLRERGWRVRVVLRSGVPVEAILSMVRQTGADFLVIGARGASGLEGVLLGSVAQGALSHCPVPVLVVR